MKILKRVKAVIAEQDKLVRELIEDLVLCDKEFEIIAAVEAEAELLRAAADADMLIVNLAQDVFGGLAALKKIKEDFPEIEIIVAGCADGEMRTKAFECGVFDCFLLRYSFPKVYEAVRHCAQSKWGSFELDLSDIAWLTGRKKESISVREQRLEYFNKIEKVLFDGEPHSVPEISEITDISASTVRRYLIMLSSAGRAIAESSFGRGRPEKLYRTALPVSSKGFGDELP